MTAEVTVVVPTRNRLTLLQEAVASVQRQTGVEWELIVVDDASADGTGDWLAGLDDGRVRAISLQEHGERSAARNRGLAEAAAPSVLFLDDDDRLCPGALAALAHPLRHDGVAVACVGAAVAFDAGNQRRRLRHPRWRVRRRFLSDAMFGWAGLQGASLYRTRAVRAAGGWPVGLSQGEDQLLWLRLAVAGPVVAIPRTVLEHRRHAGQLRPADTLDIERRARLEFLDEIHGADRARAAAAFRSRQLVEDAQFAWEATDGRRALRLVSAGIRASPSLLWSPFVGGRLAFLWLRAAGAAVAGPAGTAGAQRVLWGLRRRLRRAPGGPTVLLPPRGGRLS